MKITKRERERAVSIRHVHTPPFTENDGVKELRAITSSQTGTLRLPSNASEKNNKTTTTTQRRTAPGAYLAATTMKTAKVG